MKYLAAIIISAVLASAINLAAVFTLQQFNLIATADTDMKNLPYGLAVAFSMALAFFSFPVFFNLNPRIKENFFYSAASFFLLPVLVTIAASLAFEEDGWFVALCCLAYLAVLLVFFIRSRKDTRQLIDRRAGNKPLG